MPHSHKWRNLVCGIAGIVDRHLDYSADQLMDASRKMSRAVRHRGPDSCGEWFDLSQVIAFSHRRLAVLDLSHSADQPMVTDDGRLVLLFNGEIYNYRSLRGELAAEGVRVRGTGDTEVLLSALAQWGVSKTLARTNGMF